MSHLTPENFLRDVSYHVVEVIRDEGLYRHIRFCRPGTMCMHFDLITWPGHLCYTGDMGTYVFSRLNDMFEFFRTDREHHGELAINKGYWSEKLVAIDSNGRHGESATEFDPEKFRCVVNEHRVGWMRDAADANIDKEQRRDLWEAVESEVLDYLGDDEHDAYRRAHEFSWNAPGSRHSYQFEDLWEHDFTQYTHSFVWCCYALAWGISQYDAMKAATNTGEAA